MPELPEVETTVADLNRRVQGRRIVGVWLDWQKLKDVKQAQGREIKEVKRAGKNILVYFTDGNVLLIHMKMTGHLLIGKWEINKKKAIPAEPPELKEKINSFIHFILILDNDQMIGFSDLRKFGKVVFGPREKIENLKELKKLGPEAIVAPHVIPSRRRRVSFREFAENIKKRKKTVYQTLMDQSVIAGIGNIYANDIMFKAKVYPFKAANKLTDKELAALYGAIKSVLAKALKARGTSTADYRDTAGKKGKYGESRLIYQREGEACPDKCGGKIIRQKKGGRSAFYCPSCQKA